MSEPILRRRYVCSGSVQGVGFRYRAWQAAEAVGATGWVRNDWDGGVTMELQGTQAQHDRVLQALRQSRYITLARVETETLPPDPDERRFAVLDDRW